MPIYEYKCKVCEEQFEVEQSFTDDALTTMPGCEIDPQGDHRVRKVFSAVGISFKGDGFYRNDSRSKSSSSSSSSSGGDASANGSSSSDSGSNGSTSKSSSADKSPSSNSSRAKTPA